jgi:hypothetical protein
VRDREARAPFVGAEWPRVRRFAADVVRRAPGPAAGSHGPAAGGGPRRLAGTPGPADPADRLACPARNADDRGVPPTPPPTDDLPTGDLPTDEVEGWVRRGREALRARHYVEAREWFDRALATRPDDPKLQALAVTAEFWRRLARDGDGFAPAMPPNPRLRSAGGA